MAQNAADILVDGLIAGGIRTVFGLPGAGDHQHAVPRPDRHGDAAGCRSRSPAHYKRPIKIVVLRNNTLGQIKWEQMLFLGNPEYECDLQPINFARVAEAVGIKGFRIDAADQCAAVLDAALAEPAPALLEP